jgi:septum formation protein
LENLRDNKVMAQPRRLVLASTSRYRRELLARLGLVFEVLKPEADETPRAGEAPADLALRLSVLKARSVTAPGALVIGSDQAAALEGRLFGKPGGHEAAVRQLRELSGKSADFHTAVSVLDSKNDSIESRVVACRVTFRKLDERRIETYLRREQPYDCAGSAKIEGLGIALIERMETEDPTSLVGLPLIALTGMLERAGMSVL